MRALLVGTGVMVVGAVGFFLWAVMTTDMGDGAGNEDMMRKMRARDEDFRLGGMA